MSKLTAPLFSLAASGTIGDALTYSRWKGIYYVRTRVIPANPQSAGQTAVRELFRTLMAMWNRSGPLFREPWALASAGRPLTDRNLFTQSNIPALLGDAVLTDFVGSPGMGGALPPATAVSADGGAQVLNLTLTQPTLPAGWTQVSSSGIGILQGDPNPFIIRTPYEAEDAAAPFTAIAITVVAGTIVWACWNVYTAPDGTTRVSTALSGTQVIA